MMRTRLMQGVLGFTALTLLVGSFKVMGSKPKPPPPTTVTVSRGVVLASVNATGNVTVSDQLALDFPVGGKVIDIYVKEGQRVVAGQPLAAIDDAAGPGQGRPGPGRRRRRPGARPPAARGVDPQRAAAEQRRHRRRPEPA